MPKPPQRRFDGLLFLKGLIQSLVSPEGYPLPSRGLDLGLIAIYLITAIISREPFCNRRRIVQCKMSLKGGSVSNTR